MKKVMSSFSLEQNDKLNNYFVKAMFFHLLLMVVALLFNFVSSWDIFAKFKKKPILSLVESSVRVDVVGLPKFTLQELKLMELKSSSSDQNIEDEKSIENIKNETSEVEFKKVAKKINLTSLLKDISTKKVEINKEQNKKNITDKTKNFDARLINQLVIEGNKVSKGSSVTGQQLDMSQQVFIAYIQELPDKVKPFWKLPTYMLNKNLQCRIQIFIGSDGSVLKMNMYESSGDAEYDAKAISAVKESSPLPKPPSSILSAVASGRVILGFPL